MLPPSSRAREALAEGCEGLWVTGTPCEPGAFAKIMAWQDPDFTCGDDGGGGGGGGVGDICRIILESGPKLLMTEGGSDELRFLAECVRCALV